jgi:hypothetical protein
MSIGVGRGGLPLQSRTSTCKSSVLSTDMQLRRPSDRLAGVCWLPRFVDKARKFLDGTLPQEYALRLGDAQAVDGVFLRHFGLAKQQARFPVERPD